MKLNDLLQTVGALSGVVIILLGSGWVKSSIKTYLMKASGMNAD